jgi:hypothetical protein
MNVEVGSLGKAGQKGAQRERPALHSGLIGAGGADLRLGSAGSRRLGAKGGGCGGED